jgi:glutaredoxin-like YruB-family protein
MPVKIYSTPSCAYCNMTKRFFRGRGIKFTDYNVARDERKARFIANKTGQMGVPVIDINGTYVVGFDRAKVEHLLRTLKQ